MNKIKNGDEVMVIRGAGRGRRGVVQRIFLDRPGGKPERATVEGVNLATHYERPNPQENQPGGMIKREAPVHISNLALMDSDGRPGRVRIVVDGTGRKTREVVVAAARRKS